MKIPTLEQLERALHLRGAIEAAQAELAAALKALAEVVAPEPSERHDRESKGPFADAVEGAREQRLRQRAREPKPRKRRASRRARARKRLEESPRRNRLWSLLSGGEVGTAPVATEPKRKRARKPSLSRRRKPAAARRRRPGRKKARK